MEPIKCKTCDAGWLVRQRVHRMSGPAVTIGYILLIPSLVGIVIAILLAVSTLVGVSKVKATPHLSPSTLNRLDEARIPEEMKNQLRTGNPIPLERVQALPSEKRLPVDSANMELAAQSVGEAGGKAIAGGCGIGIAILIGGLSFVSGLLGWLLVMKKTVLACNRCGAAVAAS